MKIGIAETSRTPEMEIINPQRTDDEGVCKLKASVPADEAQTPNLRHDEFLLKILLERPMAQTQTPMPLQELSDLTGVADWAEEEYSRPSLSGAACSSPPSASVATAEPPATPGVFTRSLLEAMASNHVSVRESLSELHAPEDLKTIADAAGDAKVPSVKAANIGSASEEGSTQRQGREEEGEKGGREEERLESGDREAEEDTLHNLRDGSMVINNTAEVEREAHTLFVRSEVPLTAFIIFNFSSQEVSVKYEAISADDFLPLFTFVLVRGSFCVCCSAGDLLMSCFYCAQIQAGLPQLLLVKELMTALVNDEDSYGECGASLVWTAFP